MKPNRRIKRITGSLIVLMTVIFGLTAGLASYWGFVIAVTGFGIMWLILLIADQHFGDTLLFFLFTLFCLLGVLERLPLPWMTAILCLNLAVWNLTGFIGTLLSYDTVVHQRKLENQRLRWLALVLSGAYLLTLLPILVEIQLQFIVILIEAVLAFVLLNQALIRLRSK